ncbi:DEAD/DEAH box helicase [Halosimplex halophilum]|uniref:DEAD/DEAH box helicase n=1 Tax=Halosimplex halophilum TaxID=2559572 RepID=UPI00107F96AC|nr:DEAD/DEAH box helicase [Halosimplex halophilum]
MTDDQGEPSLDRFHEAVEAAGNPVLTTEEVARNAEEPREAVESWLADLEREGSVVSRDVSQDPTVWYPAEWTDYADRERFVVFPDRRQIVVDRPAQFTRAQLSQFARLVDTNGDGGYVYEIDDSDVWQAPYEDLEGLLGTVRDVLPQRYPDLEEWIGDQWKRAHQFTLKTHEDGYVVLEAATENLMGNVARQKLGDEHLRAPISDTESWVAEEATAEVKRILYEAGYPVQDERDLESGDPLDLTLNLDLREYQHDWVSRFMETKSGVLVGPPGSGKTVAAMGIVERVAGETLILVPSRELVRQWRDELLAHTTLDESQVGEYHGGKKDIRPVTVATYQTAGMDRHRHLFDSREWGLIVYDEVQHVPSDVYRRSANLQTRHRLGLSASPVREDDLQEEIFTLIGPPIGTDWDALFDEGFVAEPTVEIRYVPWTDDDHRNEYVGSEGHERRQIAASNPAKVEETRRILREHPEQKALVFVDYLDQGRELAAALDAPFISGDTPHHERARKFEQFREGSLDTLVVSRVGDEGIDLPDASLAIVASGLGGSRRQGTQRAGRTMRPAGRALMYVLATQGAREEEFARRQMRYLAGKGVQVRERTVEGPDDDGDEGDSGEAGAGDEPEPDGPAEEDDEPPGEDDDPSLA